MKKRSNLSKKCEYCGEIFHKDPHSSYKQWYNRKYCSTTCSSMAFVGFKHSEETKKYLSEFWTNRPKPYLMGPNNTFWKGGVYKKHRREKDRFMHTLAYKKWRRDVLSRDNYKCSICGSTDNLQAHHIKPYYLYKELALDIDNGQTLCFECHKKTESYGSNRRTM